MNRKKRTFRSDYALACGRHVGISGISLLLLSVLKEAASDSAKGILEAKEFLEDSGVSRFYNQHYSVRNLPTLFAEHYHESMQKH